MAVRGNGVWFWKTFPIRSIYYYYYYVGISAYFRTFISACSVYRADLIYFNRTCVLLLLLLLQSARRRYYVIVVTLGIIFLLWLSTCKYYYILLLLLVGSYHYYTYLIFTATVWFGIFGVASPWGVDSKENITMGIKHLKLMAESSADRYTVL